MDLAQAVVMTSPQETGPNSEQGCDPTTAADVSVSSFDDDFQLSSSAPAILMSAHFGNRPVVASLSPMVHVTTSPSASTLQLCRDKDKALASGTSSAHSKATSNSCGQLSMAGSAPVVTENPFRFTVSSLGSAATNTACFVGSFEPIEEQITSIVEVDSKPLQPEPQVVYNLPTVLITGTASSSELSTKLNSNILPTVTNAFSAIDTEINDEIGISKEVGIGTIRITNTHTPCNKATVTRPDTKIAITTDPQTVTATETAEDTSMDIQPKICIGKCAPGLLTPTVTTTDILKGIRDIAPTATQTSPPTFTPSTTTTTGAAAALFDNTATMSSNRPFTNQFQSIDPTSNDAPHQHHVHQHQYQHHRKTTTTIINNTLNENHTTATITNNTTTTPSCCTKTIATDSQVSVSVSASVSSANASTSSRRQRHSIAGQMSYMKMLGFGGFSKKMATSANSLFSTAVISGSSSAPNLRDMITVSSSGEYALLLFI